MGGPDYEQRGEGARVRGTTSTRALKYAHHNHTVL